jgi:cell division protein FtsB
MKIRRAVWPVLIVVVLIGVLFVAVFPTRTWIAQKSQTASATRQLDILEEQNTKLSARVDALQSDDEIERLAREQYNLVMPGEEAYALLPAPGTPSAEAEPEPAPATEKADRSVPSKVWHFLTDWL